MTTFNTNEFDTAEFDITDPVLFDNGIPHELFARLRAAPGLVWNPDSQRGQGFWSVTRHADLVAVSRDTDTFSSELGHIQIYDIDADVRAKRASMIDLDPPMHTRLRRLVSAAFTPRHVNSYRASAKRRIVDALDTLEANGGGDWVSTVAAPIPIGVICDILGVPDADHQLMIEMSDHLVEGTAGVELDPSAYGNTTPLRELPFNSPAAWGIYDYATKARARVLANPGDDLLSKLAIAEIDGDRLDETEFARFFQLMIFAGNETTRSAMAHLATQWMDFGDQFERLGSDLRAIGLGARAVDSSSDDEALDTQRHAVIDAAGDEVVRHCSPILYFRRTATRDTELSGTPIAAGDKVVMWYASANFDETVFERALELDLRRPRVPASVAFGGGGAHYCLGASLARLELSLLLDEMVRRNLHLTRAGEQRNVRSNFVNGVAELAVAVRS